jgi:hypothetical protein
MIEKDCYLGVTAENRARFTVMFRFTAVAIWATSYPMFSPSRSLSVQMIRTSALRASCSSVLLSPS